MRSQHISQCKIISTITSSVSSSLGWRPTNAIKTLPFLHLFMHAELNRLSSTLFFLLSACFHLFHASCLRPHSMPTHLSGFRREYEWKNVERFCDSLFPASDSDHALISTDLVLFSCGGVERDKVDHTGRTDTGDEAMTGKSRRWNRLRNRTVNGRGMKVSMSARDKALCTSELFPLSRRVIPPVQICKCMSHTRRSGRVPSQDWVLVKDEVIPSTCMRADVLTMASAVCFQFFWHDVSARL